MKLIHKYLISFILLFIIGCGQWPPVVENSKDIKALSSSETSLRTRGLPDEDIHLLQKFEAIKQLDFYGGWGAKEAKITDVGLKTLSNLHFPQLETLSLGSNKNITDNGLVYVAQMNSIKLLDLMDCANITDRGLEELTKLANLNILDLRGCGSVTDKGLLQLGSMKNLKQIFLAGCEGITQEGIREFKEKRPKVTVNNDIEEWSRLKKN